MKKVLSLICVFSICLLLGFTTEPKSVSAAGDPNLHQLILTNNDCYKAGQYYNTYRHYGSFNWCQ